MSSRGRRQAQAGFDWTRDYRDSHHSASQGNRDDEYAESELSYISAFEGLNLNGAPNTQYGPTPIASPSRAQIPPTQPYHFPRADPRAAQGNVQSTEPWQIEHRIDSRNSLGLVSANDGGPLPIETSRSPLSRPLRPNPENMRNAYHSRQGYGSPSWWQSPSERNQYRPYPEEDRFTESRREMTLECQCRTCVEHRHAIRNWATSRYDNRGIPPTGRPNYYPYTYPGPSSRGRYPTQSDWINRDEDRYDNDSDYSSYESDSSGLDEHRNQAVQRPDRRTACYPRDTYDRGDSDHEDSDNASYTGYERYDVYGDEHGEYEGGRYSY